MKLIDKDALVAEIEKQKKSCERDGPYWCGRVNSYNDIISMLDTLEVKEVDLDKPFEGIKVQTSMESGSLDEVIVTTKYKAQKGEKV